MSVSVRSTTPLEIAVSLLEEAQTARTLISEVGILQVKTNQSLSLRRQTTTLTLTLSGFSTMVPITVLELRWDTAIMNWVYWHGREQVLRKKLLSSLKVISISISERTILNVWCSTKRANLASAQPLPR